MHRPALLALLLLPAVLAPAAAEEHPAGDGIAWAGDLVTAMAGAKESKKVVMVCVNAQFVEGRQEEEPAAKGLREVVYRDPRIVKRSRDFACVFLTPRGGSADYNALRALGVEGAITSPQHIFIAPEGDRILLRKAYWSHGKGEPAVTALLELMDQAAEAAKGKAPAPAPAPAGEGPGAPPEGDQRALWIGLRLQEVRDMPAERERSLEVLIRADRGGDCTSPLVAMLGDPKADAALLVAVVRALGRDGLEAAALPVAHLLSHREEAVRGNAAVSLEYIGSRDEKVIAALLKHVGREKNESIANHAFRALGRCGVKDARARALLLTEANSAKSEFASYGPCIGLAYFAKDKAAARGVEKLLKQVGVPGGRRGGGQDIVKRGLVSWTLASIGDPDSARFVEEEMIDGLKNVKAFWVDGLREFWWGVVAACKGEEGALGRVEGGVRGFAQFARGGDMGRYGAETRNLMDDYRAGRGAAGFKPKGDGLLDE